jgi:hypothetical protein
MAANLASVIEREFQEVQKTREDLLAKRAEIDEQLKGLDLRLKAAENYRATLAGKFNDPPASRTRRPTRRAGSREELRQMIVEAVKQHPEGMVSDQINSALGVTDPKQKQQVANLLSLLKKEGVIQQEARRGPYVAA